MNPTTTDTPASAVTTWGPTEIEQLPWRPVAGCPGVCQKILWKRGEGADALIRYSPGAATPGVAHPSAEHHIWVLRGKGTIAGRPLMTGSYVYVPMSTAHPIRNTGPETLQLLQVHRPMGPDGPWWTAL